MACLRAGQSRVLWARRGRGLTPVKIVSLEASGIDPEERGPEEDEEEIPVESLKVVREIVRERVPGLRAQRVVRS